MSSLVVLLRKQQVMISKYFTFVILRYAIDRDQKFIAIRLKVLVCYFDPNRFPFWVVGWLRGSQFGTGGTLFFGVATHPVLKSVTDCQ